jgi:hypothetical protein
MLDGLSPQELKKLESTFKVMKEKASEDPIYFITTFVYIFNPKVSPPNIPFKMFDFQKRLARDVVNAVYKGEDVFVDKTREMGVTYTILATLMWMWLFEQGSNFLLGSRKEDYVDSRRGGVTGNKEESLFGKIDYMLSRLPPFMMPKGFNQSRHFTHMSLINPENGNAMLGESANPDFSRGGRQRAIFMDEFAFWDNGAAVWGSTADTTNCRIIATTPGIKPSKAKRLRFGKDGEKIKIITLNYNLDPRKNKKWLEEQRERRSVEDFGREIMVDWETSITGRVYPELENAAYGDFPFLSNQALYCAGDYGLDGTVFLFWQENPHNGKMRMIDAYVNEDQIIQFYFPLFGQPLDSKFQYTDDDLKAFTQISQYPKAIHFGDVDVRKKSFIKSSSTQKEFAKIGIHVQSITGKNWLTRRDITKVYLGRGIEVNANPRTDYVLEAMKMYRYPQRSESSEATTPVVKPIHDYCLAGETKIRTLFGWKKIKDLVNKDFYVWSYSKKMKRMVPAKAGKCWKVKKSKTIQIKIDNGKTIRCTDNHKFMLRDGTYKQAGDLSVGDSLMPFYERAYAADYIDVYLNDGSLGPEHRIVYNWFNGNLKQDYHIHHIDGVKTNNNPENLEQISKEEHCKITKPQNAEKISQSLKQFNKRNKYLKTCPTCRIETNMLYKQTYCSKTCQRVFYNEVKKQDYKVNSEKKTCVVCREIFDGYPRQKTCSSSCAKARKENYGKIYNKFYQTGLKISMDMADCYLENHKVIEVIKDNLLVDVYDLEVPIYHNFVANGVVTHNSSHPSTAMEYLFLNLDSFKQIQEEPPSWAHKTKKWLTNKSIIRKRR